MQRGKVENATAEMLRGLDQLMERKEGGGMYLLWVSLIGDVRTLMIDEAHASRYLVHSGADKTYYDLRDMYGGHVWRRILLPMLPRSSSGYDTNWVIVDRLTKVVHFGKKGKLAPRYVGPFEILEMIGPVAYKLRLPKELSEVHDTFHVSNLKKCLADSNLHVPLEEIKVDKTLHFVEEPVEIIDCEVKNLKRSRIPIVKSIGTQSEIIRIS
ncbi:hypothetical protein Tco_0656338 [Tanacetum coccineum]|uniref:Tf2-1-like SH3-like domain-containing protein n=1 Tax=Tanacetum coccineum TaxID=301880 RepID=A0ABQ4X8H4_9ASTR